MRVIVWTIAIVTASAVAWTNTAHADDEPAPPSDAAVGKLDAAPEEKGPEHFRVDLGLALGAFGTGSGWIFYPMPSLGFELHAAGPAWVVAALNAGYWKADYDGSTSENKTVGGRLGVRLETPVFEWLEAGGYALLVGNYNTASDGTSDYVGGMIGGVAGASAHLRASEFFGVRLLLDAFHAGKIWSNSQDVESSSTFVDFIPRPEVQLTFTF